MVIAILIAIITLMGIQNIAEFIVGLMTLGLLTDIFDGIIARKLGIATVQLRTWDSNVDQFFWIIVIASVFSLNSAFLKENYLPIIAIVILEALAYLTSYLKFKRTVATHSYLAKFWTLTLLAFLIDLTLNSNSHLLFKICAALGIVSRIEIILIILGLKKWTTDVSSIFSINRINKEK
jgi:CDP-diacylglycerol--glycerol-3-phosphate 3-phosphatidyltransferase